MAGGTDIYLRFCRVDIKQVIVVKHVGGDKGVGADCIGHLFVELTDVVGACHPVCVQDRVSGYLHFAACQIVAAGGYIVPAPEFVAVLAGGCPGVRQPDGAAHLGGVGRIGRAGQVTQAAVCAIQPDGAVLSGNGRGIQHDHRICLRNQAVT